MTPATIPQFTSKEIELNLVLKIWRGDVSLVQTYWLWNVLGGFGVGLLMVFTAQSSFLSTLTFAAMIVYSVWILVAIWRSSGKYQGSKLWVYLSRLAVILGTVQLLILTVPLLVSPFK